jgi:uncharacterized protein YdeI (YjbR/CyaY-like superfamily)
MDPASVFWIDTADDWERWLAAHHDSEIEVWIGIYKKASGKQTVGFDALLELAICWGWIDVQTKGIDDERYGIRVRRRKPGSNWSPTNRRIVCRLIAENRIQHVARATLPPDLECLEPANAVR